MANSAPWPAVALGLPGSSTIAAKHAAAVRCTIAGAPGHQAMESSRRRTSDWTHSASRTLRSKDEVRLGQVQSNTCQDNHHLCPGDAIRIEGYVGITTALGPRD